MVSFLKSVADRQMQNFASLKQSLIAAGHSFGEYAGKLNADNLHPISEDIYSGLQAAMNELAMQENIKSSRPKGDVSMTLG